MDKTHSEEILTALSLQHSCSNIFFNLYDNNATVVEVGIDTWLVHVGIDT